jgi:hypothetical protein
VGEGNSLLKFLIVGVAGYIAYDWLQTSGLWAQWFGGVQTFTTPATLLAYCQANPSASASYNGQTGTCVQWQQAAGAQPATAAAVISPAASTPAAATSPAASEPSAADVALANSLVTAAKTSASTTMNVWQWNYILQHLNPSEANLNTSNNAQLVTAAQYVALRTASGLSGLGVVMPTFPRAMAHSQIPYRWLM